MNNNASVRDDGKWYLSYEILYYELTPPSEQEKYTVWENLVLIKADSPEEAFEKAMRHGSMSEGNVKKGDQRAVCKFKGLKNLIKIYEEIGDGAEIEWKEYELNRDKLESIIPEKERLHAFQPLPPAEDFE
jgi:hypothetical protein